MVNCQEEQAKSFSHKNEKSKSYTLSFKLLVVKHAKMPSTGAAERKFGVDRKRIRESIQNERNIPNKVSSKNRGSFAKKVNGGGRKIKHVDLEEILLEWITLRRSKDLRVSLNLIQSKARIIYAEEKAASKDQMNEFMSRKGLSLRRRTTQAQKLQSK